jgi:regulator of sirC expression with transglutaminase-like and TPR domain
MFNRANEIYLNAIKAAVARLDYDEALALSTHIGHFFTFTPVMHRERGVWLLRLGRKSEARAELQLAQAALPDDARVKFFIAEAQK